MLLLTLQTYLKEWGVGALKKYKIELFNLSLGEHEYVFDFDDEFLNNFENSLVKKGAGEIKIGLKKTETFIELEFEIAGSIELICDRSLDLFDFPIQLNEKLVYKFGEESDNWEDSDIIFIPWNTQSINVAQSVYEFISVAIPLKKLHPRCKNEDLSIDDHLIYSSGKQSDNNKYLGNKEDEVDPRWQRLQELRNEYKDNK